jgi:hypothetical protein
LSVLTYTVQNWDYRQLNVFGRKGVQNRAIRKHTCGDQRGPYQKVVPDLGAERNQ